MLAEQGCAGSLCVTLEAVSLSAPLMAHDLFLLRRSLPGVFCSVLFILVRMNLFFNDAQDIVNYCQAPSELLVPWIV